MKCTWLVHPYEWRSGTSDGLFLPIYPPRSMRIVFEFLMTSKFLQQVYEFFWLMFSPWIIRTPFTLSLLLASLVPCNFCRYHTPTIYLPQNSHHTYLLWHFHRISEIYCPATFHRSVYYGMFHHCHISLCMIMWLTSYLWQSHHLNLHTCRSWFIAYPGIPPEAFT